MIDYDKAREIASSFQSSSSHDYNITAFAHGVPKWTRSGLLAEITRERLKGNRFYTNIALDELDALFEYVSSLPETTLVDTQCDYIGLNDIRCSNPAIYSDSNPNPLLGNIRKVCAEHKWIVECERSLDSLESLLTQVNETRQNLFKFHTEKRFSDTPEYWQCKGMLDAYECVEKMILSAIHDAKSGE